MGIDVPIRHLGFLLQGVQMTLLVSIAAIAIGATVGLAIALLRLSGSRVLSAVAGLYVDVLRSVPFFVQLIWWFYALPVASGIRLDAVQCGIIALGLYGSAYFAEAFRSGILSVPAGEREASIAQGMTWFQSQRRVVLPIATRNVLTSLTNVVIIIVKDSSIVSVLGVADLMYKGGALATFLMRPLEVLTLVGILYMLIAYPFAVLGGYLAARAARRM